MSLETNRRKEIRGRPLIGLFCVVLVVFCLMAAGPGCIGPTGTTKTDITHTTTSTTLTSSAASTTSGTTASLTTSTSQVGPSGLIESMSASTTVLHPSYQWTYKQREWMWDLKIPEALYDYYKGLPRAPTQNYSIYVTHPLDDSCIAQAVSEIEKAAADRGFSDWEKVNFTRSFVQSLPYTVDSETTPFDEYPRYPVETLVDGGGDCEDTSILLAALLRAMNYDVVLLEFSTHMAVGVSGGEGVYGTYWSYEGKKYFYIETTGAGWGIGEIPDAYVDSTAKVLVMKPVPVITHTWTSTSSGSRMRLKVVIDNLGSADASGFQVLAGFDAGDSQAWNVERSEHFDLAMGSRVTVEMTLEIPRNEYTRVLVQILNSDDKAVDRTYSKWFDT